MPADGEYLAELVGSGVPTELTAVVMFELMLMAELAASGTEMLLPTVIVVERFDAGSADEFAKTGTPYIVKFPQLSR